MEENNEHLQIKIRELEKQVAQLNAQLKQKRYGLTWIDVPEAFDSDSEDKIPVLEEVPELAIHNKDGKPTHILIEGDNYHALTCLNFTHRGLVDVIYFDPPYNTGKKFTYRDKRYLSEYPDGTPIPKNHPLRHSTWLSFMFKRLCLAYDLLSDSGVMFISIDDNEQARLKLLCDQIFGEENAIGPIIQDKLNSKNDTVNVQKNHEFILCYRKKKRIIEGNENKIIPNIVVNGIKTREVFKEGDEFYFLNDSITTRGEGGTLNARYKLGYTFYYNPNTKDLKPVADYDLEKAKVSNNEQEVYTSDDELLSQGYVIIRPPKVRAKLGCWTWKIQKAENLKKYLYVEKTRNRYNIKSRTFVPSDEVYESEGKYYYDEDMGANSKSILPFSTNDGTTVYKSIMGEEKEFDNPKNVSMIEYLIRASSKSNSIILDFFGGSGTTLHATLLLNDEDKERGQRQCIICQINEENICREITYERNKRVMEGYKDYDTGEDVEGLGNSLKYYRTSFVGKNAPKRVDDDDRLALAKKAGCLLSLAENTLYEQQTTEFYQIFTDEKDNWTCIYFQEDYCCFDEFKEKVVNLGGKKNVYVFCWTNGAEFASEFEFKKDIEVKSIPQPILDIYKTLNV